MNNATLQMERRALGQLLADVGAGRIDTVVVYKVDRLTRARGLRFRNVL
jgi:DNA invertase Pin-like site-specific DNA recombinase